MASDAQLQIKENKNYYSELLVSKNFPNIYEDFIEKDLARSFT